MTDPELADRTYIEPLTPNMSRRSSALSQRCLPRKPGFRQIRPLAHRRGPNRPQSRRRSRRRRHPTRYNVELIGAKLEAIKKAEDRLLFKDAMLRIGLEVPKSALVNNLRDGLDYAGKLGFPVLIRPSFTLGGFRRRRCL